MNKRKVIKKLALPAAVIAGISLVVLLIQIPLDNARNKQHSEDFKKYFASFTEMNKKYLVGIAEKIKSIPVSQVLINELQSEYLVDHQRSDIPKKYLWMSDMNGGFFFGVPSGDFERMNNGFNKYSDLLTTDGYYRDRNDFLMDVINKNVEFSRFEDINQPSVNYRDLRRIRFYSDENWGLIQPTSTNFSTSVYDSKGALIGKLFMKVDDKVNETKYHEGNNVQRDDFFQAVTVIAGILLGISGAFLWFLLPTWVYVDAQERDVKTPGIWAFLTLTSLFFGLTIYLITRPSALKSFNCPKCDGELNGTRAYCPHCGYDLSNTFCQQCQYPIKPEWQFCPNCRAESKASVNSKNLLNESSS